MFLKLKISRENLEKKIVFKELFATLKWQKELFCWHKPQEMVGHFFIFLMGGCLGINKKSKGRSARKKWQF